MVFDPDPGYPNGVCDHPPCDADAEVPSNDGHEYCSVDCRKSHTSLMKAAKRAREEKREQERGYNGKKHRGDGSYTPGYRRWKANHQ